MRKNKPAFKNSSWENLNPLEKSLFPTDVLKISKIFVDYIHNLEIHPCSNFPSDRSVTKFY